MTDTTTEWNADDSTWNTYTRTTPTGIPLGYLTPGTPEWDQARAGLTVTATEIAAIVGLSPWQSRFSLWHKKSGMPTAPFEPSPQTEWGLRLEDVIATKWEEDHQDTTEVLPAGTWQHKTRRWQRATPDFMFTGLTGWEIRPGELPQLLEIKTAAAADGWGPSGSDEIPVHYRCQAMWQLDTLGLATCHFAVLIGGSDYREYVVQYDEDDAYVLRSAAEEFLDDVRNGVRPPIDDSTATYQTVKAQPDGMDDVDVEIPASLGARYLDAVEAHRAAEAEKRQAAAEVLDLIGTGRRAVDGDRRIAYRTVRDGRTRSLTPYRQKDTA